MIKLELLTDHMNWHQNWAAQRGKNENYKHIQRKDKEKKIQSRDKRRK